MPSITPEQRETESNDLDPSRGASIETDKTANSDLRENNINLESIQSFFALLQFERDSRRPPDERRRAQFRVGWEDDTKRGAVYSRKSLKRLTWRNLGYRLGKHFGDRGPIQINVAFDVLVALYEPPFANENASKTAPSPEQYVAAFRRMGNVTASQMQMLRFHYHAPSRTVTAKQVASGVGYRNYSAANLHYGRLAGLVGAQLDYRPEPEMLGTLVIFDKRRGEWHWLLRPEVAEALESLGWVEGGDIPPSDEITLSSYIVEGAICRVPVNAYERSPEARRNCIEYHGTNCCICGFNFGSSYGEIAEGYIHVHHLRPLSEIRGEYIVDPIEDLRPVCPNCHAVLHRRTPAFSIEEVRVFWRQCIPGT